MNNAYESQSFDWTLLVRPVDQGRFELIAICQRPYGTKVWRDRLERFVEVEHTMLPGDQILRLIQESINEGYKLVHGEWSNTAVRQYADGVRYRDDARIHDESQSLSFEINRALGRTPSQAAKPEVSRPTIRL